MAAKPRKLNATKANSQAPPRSLSAQHNEVVHRAVDLAVLMVFFSGTYAVGRMTFASSEKYGTTPLQAHRLVVFGPMLGYVNVLFYIYCAQMPHVIIIARTVTGWSFGRRCVMRTGTRRLGTHPRRQTTVPISLIT